MPISSLKRVRVNGRRILIGAVGGLALAATVAAAQEPGGPAITTAPSAAIEREAKSRITFGRSVEDRALRVVRFGDAEANRDVLVVGSTHGDETEGHEIVRELKRSYADISGVEFWVVKTMNPDGVKHDIRKNARGVDLNRNFSYRWSDAEPPSSGYYGGPKPFSEPESRAIKDLAKRIQPRRTLFYHQPWNAVLVPCNGRSPVQRDYARVAGMETSCRGDGLPGTATSWLNHNLAGLAFVIELDGGELGDRAAAHHARAIASISKPEQASHAASRSHEARARGEGFNRPKIKWDPIPFGGKRKRQTAEYSKRHYGKSEWRLQNPKQIVIHYTVTSTYPPVFNTFAANEPSLGERPGVCTQFVVDKDGTIYQLVDAETRCRHAIGLNHRSIGIEIVQEANGSPERSILNRRRQRVAAQKLAGWLGERYEIRTDDVIGHAMVNDSRYFEDRQGWRNDHTDWRRRYVKEFRRGIRKLAD